VVRQKFTVIAVVTFLLCLVLAQFWELASTIGRKQHFSQGKELDNFIKHTVLTNEYLKATTTAIRYYMNNFVLIPFRNFLLSIPTPAFIALIVVIAWRIAGPRQALIAFWFFLWVALSGWWDRSVITIYYALSSTCVAMVLGIPLAVWGAGPPAQRINWTGGITSAFMMSLFSLLFRRSFIAMASILAAGIARYILWSVGLFGAEPDPSLYRFVFWLLFACSFYLMWYYAGRMLRDVFLLLVSDSAQTFPSFVYLIPAIMLFGITDIAVIFAIMIFAMVPLIRYTIEGLRNVPPEMTESADMSGATRAQKLWKVQFPLALPTMAVGFNQALMFAFFMTMIAAFIGTIDLGQELQRTLAGTDLGKNFVLGINVSLMALTFDMIIIRWAERRKALLGLM
jgi:ABC-type proline/glycine betaine transport system permease subunit